MALLTQASLAALGAGALDAELTAGTPSGPMRGLRSTSAPQVIEAFNWARWEYMLGVDRRKEQWRAAAGRKVPGSHVVIYTTKTPRVRTLTYTWRNVMDKHAEQQLTVENYGAQMHTMMRAMEARWLRYMEQHVYELGNYKYIEQRALQAVEPVRIQYHERALTWAGLTKDPTRALVSPRSHPTHRTLIGSGPSPSVISLNARGPSGRAQSWKMPGGRSRTRSASTA